MDADEVIHDVAWPAEITELLNFFLEELTTCWPGIMNGLYITGSIALKDYQPGKSDVDFVMFCDRLPSRSQQKLFAKRCLAFSSLKGIPAFNGWIFTNRVLQSSFSEKVQHLYFEKGKFRSSHDIIPTVVLLELKIAGVPILGSSTDFLEIEVSQRDVRNYIFQNVNSYWKNWINDHARFYRKKLWLVLFPRLSEWVILGLARQFYTLQTGLIATKSHAGNYMLSFLPPQFHDIVHHAIRIRNDNSTHFFSLKNGYHIQPSLIRCAQTLSCAHYIRNLINEFNQKNNIQ